MAKDIIGVVTSVEDDDYQGKSFKKVTLGTGEVLKVKYGREGALKAKWGLLQEGVAIHFMMKDFMKQGVAYPFVEDIEVDDLATVASELPPAVEVKTVEVPLTELPPKPTPQPPPAPQAVGMMTKEIGDMIRAHELVNVFGNKIAVELVKWYRSQALGISRVDFDGKDLPEYK